MMFDGMMVETVEIIMFFYGCFLMVFDGFVMVF